MRVNPLLNRQLLEATLGMALDRAMSWCNDVEYGLVGTGAALLHGVVLPAADIDILVSERLGVQAFSDALSCFECRMMPTFLENTRQYYAEFSINGVEVGISTVELETDLDWIETYGPGPWVHYVSLPCGSAVVPTVALELRLITELYRDRPDRYHPLIEHLSTEGFDAALLRRGIQRLEPSIQAMVLARLDLRAH
jgi:hypothetical protein